MPLRRIEKVRKRNGSIVPFEESKIASAIDRAAGASGQKDRHISQDLASVVSMYLERYYEKEVAESADIRRFVEKVLLETGHADIARNFIREQAEPEPASGSNDGMLFPAQDVRVDASTRDETTRWWKGRIEQALVRESGMDATIARDIANAVEQKILDSGIRHLSTGLIRELVDVELFERGYEKLLRSQTLLGIPKYDLQKWVYGESDVDLSARGPGELAREISGATLRQFALEEVYGADVSAAHLDGRIHIHHLSRPMHLFWLAPSLEHLKRTGLPVPGWPRAAQPAEDLRELSDQVGLLRRRVGPYVSEATEWNAVNVLAAPYARDLELRELRREATGLLRGLGVGVFHESPGSAVGIHLGIPGYLATQPAVGPGGLAGRDTYDDLDDAVHGMTRALCEAWEDLVATGDEPVRDRFTFTVNQSTIRQDRYAQILQSVCGRVVQGRSARFVFERDDQLFSRPSRWSRSQHLNGELPWTAVGQVTTLNLPRLAYECGEPDLKDFFHALDHSIELAATAAQARDRLIRRRSLEPDRFGREIQCTERGRGVVGLDQLVYPIGLSGLAATVKYLSGTEFGEDEESVAFGLRILSYVHLRMKEESRKTGLNLSIEDVPCRSACERFARLDLGRFVSSREVLSPGADRMIYSEGFHLREGLNLDVRQRIEAESRFHTLVESGCVTLRLNGRWTGPELYDLLCRTYSTNRVHQVLVIPKAV